MTYSICENRHQHNETNFPLSSSPALRRSMHISQKQNSLEPCRRNNDLISQPLHVCLHGFGGARDRTHHHLMHASVTLAFDLAYRNRCPSPAPPCQLHPPA